MKVLIVGGVAAGASCAARLRRLDETAEIIMFEKSGFISYANCGLPYYVGGVIEDRMELTLQTPESFFQRFRVDVRTHQEVIELRNKEKKVLVKNLTTGEMYEESYDKLVLAPGAKPTRPKMEGADLDQVFTLRTVEDTLAIHKFVQTKKPKSVVIAGGGYIGVEIAENLCEMGLEVTIVQKPNQLLAPLDFDMACNIHAKLRNNGIRLELEQSVLGFSQKGQAIETLLESEKHLLSDFVILAIGVTPDTQFLESSQMKRSQKGSIVVNEKMETSIPDVYAAGDAVEVEHYVTKEKTLISLAGPANKQGRIIADNICGGEATYKGSQGSSVVKLFDMTVATTGINEKNAKALGIDYDYIILHPSAHATYYPGAQTMTVKVLFERQTAKLLGAQIVGYDGVDKRIDVLATAIHSGMKAIDLAELDLAYAPPYSSAKDPVNMAGFMIENIVTEKMKQFYYEDIENLKKEDVTFIDARSLFEYSMEHVPGFRNIPVDELRDRINEVPKGKKVYVMCQSGLRSYIACRILKQNGFDAYNFTGGFRYYQTIKNEVLMQAETYSCGMNRR